jgi:threonine dehydratase
MIEVTLQHIYEAREAIHGISCRTPLVLAPRLSTPGRQVLLKLETAQPIGAFKIRGAANALARLRPEERQRGVVCASTGNHGRAVAYAAARLGVPACVCLSRLVPAVKVTAIEALGAEVRVIGTSQDDAQTEVDRLVAEEGRVELPPFDHPDIIAGQGTIGLELLEDCPDLDTVVVPLSGGGLMAGIARAIKSASPAIRVVGVCMERGAAMHQSLLAGHPVEVVEEPTLADSLGGGIGLGNRHTFAMVRQLVDQVVLLSEAQIAGAMRALFLQERWVAEGGGAVGIAPLLEPGLVTLGRRVAVVISGRNIDMGLFRRIVDGEVPS